MIGHIADRHGNSQRGEEPFDVSGSEPGARHGLPSDEAWPPAHLAELEIVPGRLVVEDDRRGAAARRELTSSDPADGEPIGAPRIGLPGVAAALALEVHL